MENQDISISDLKNEAFVVDKKLSNTCIQVFKAILDRAVTDLDSEKSTEENKVKYADYYNVYDKDTQQFDEAKFHSVIAHAFNKSTTFNRKDPVVKFFIYRLQKPTQTEFFLELQDSLCTQKVYRATSTFFLQTATRDYIIETRNKLREIKAEDEKLAAQAHENRDRRVLSEADEKYTIQLYQYFKDYLDKIDHQQERPVISKLIDEKYSDKGRLSDIKNSSDNLLAEFIKYQNPHPVLDYFIMLFIAYLNKDMQVFESALRNFKENTQLQLFSLLLLKRMAKKDLSDEAVIYKKITDLILTISKNYNGTVVLEMIKTAISLNQTLFQAGEEKGIANILTTLVNKEFYNVAIAILKENPDLNNDGDLQNYIKHELTVHYTVRDTLLNALLNSGG